MVWISSRSDLLIFAIFVSSARRGVPFLVLPMQAPEEITQNLSGQESWLHLPTVGRRPDFEADRDAERDRERERLLEGDLDLDDFDLVLDEDFFVGSAVRPLAGFDFFEAEAFRSWATNRSTRGLRRMLQSFAVIPVLARHSFFSSKTVIPAYFPSSDEDFFGAIVGVDGETLQLSMRMEVLRDFPFHVGGR